MRPDVVTISDFKRVVSWGSKGVSAVAQCPSGYLVVAGGSSSSDGSSVGTGHADLYRNGWVVKPDSGASAEAFATCAARKIARKAFRWRSAGPVSGLAAAQCGPHFMLVTGYGLGTVTASWFDQSTNTYWIGGGGTAYASCARDDAGIAIKHAWNRSQKPKTVYAGCGDGYTAIGGAMGDSQWPGPPIQQHPGLSSGPGTHGYAGWWTFSNALNELTWAACVRQ
ncbi:MAG: hypothetical protein WA814_03740 [Candidatus Baltobacteraceae bacterium]